MYSLLESRLKTFLHEYVVTLRQVNTDLDRFIDSEYALYVLAAAIPLVLTLGTLGFFKLLVS